MKMAMSPSSLLAKLDELKQWQQVQQERLLKQHHARLEAANAIFPHLSASNKEIDNDSSSNYEQCGVVVPKFDKDTEENEKLSNHHVRFNDPIQSPEDVPKKPYLKRGTGLAKYGLQYGDQKKPFNKMKTPRVYKTAFHKRLDQIRKHEVLMLQKQGSNEQDVRAPPSQAPRERAQVKPPQAGFKGNVKPKEDSTSELPTEITPLRAPEICIKPKAKWCPVETDDYDSSCVPSTLPSGSLPGISHISDCKRQVDASTQNIDEPNQIENFQLQLLQNNPELLQCLQKLASEHFGTPDGNVSNSVTFDQTDLLNKLTHLENETQCQTPISNNNAQLVKYLQDIFKMNENTPGDLTSYENALEKELRVFEQLEEKAMNSSFCSTNSSVMELLASTPHRVLKNKVPTFQTIQEGINNVPNTKKHVQSVDVFSQPETIGKVSTDMQKNVVDIDCTLQSRGSSNAKKMLVYPQVHQNHKEISVQVDYSDESSINSDDFGTTSSVHKRIVRQNASTMTDPIQDVNEELLKIKFQELEAEILSFRTENKKIESIKADLGRERAEYHRSKRALEKEFNEKREEMEYELEEERKKFSKEKLVFEKYTKEMQNKPNRKEREEISNLKAELAIVRDTLKVKESRNGTTQARLRTQLKSLEKDNTHLKEEIEKLQKVNARLQNQTLLGRRGRQDETKMLHEISKNLTKLTKDQKVVKALNKLENSMEEKNSSEDSLLTLNTLALSGVRANDRVAVKSTKGKKTPRKAVESGDLEEAMKTNTKSGKTRGISEASSGESSSEDVPIQVRGTKAKKRSGNYETEYRRSYSRASYKSDSESESRATSRSRSVSSPTSVEKRKSTENKENESSNGDITTFRNLSDLSITENYEKVFGVKGKGMKSVKEAAREEQGEGRQLKRHSSLNDTQQSNCKVETILPDGSKETKYPNGNVKTVSADGTFVKMEYFNGDIKETALTDGMIKYFYKDTQIWQTTFATGDETFEFPDGQVEKHFLDGSSHVQFPNGIVKHVSTDGCEQINYPDGSVVNIKQDGEKVLLLPNGQKEIHNEKHKRREYPDGTVKIIYTDGLQETRYSNGRIRMKDKDGHLIMDTHKD